MIKIKYSTDTEIQNSFPIFFFRTDLKYNHQYNKKMSNHFFISINWEMLQSAFTDWTLIVQEISVVSNQKYPEVVSLANEGPDVQMLETEQSKSWRYKWKAEGSKKAILKHPFKSTGPGLDHQR